MATDKVSIAENWSEISLLKKQIVGMPIKEKVIFDITLKARGSIQKEA